MCQNRNEPSSPHHSPSHTVQLLWDSIFYRSSSFLHPKKSPFYSLHSRREQDIYQISQRSTLSSVRSQDKISTFNPLYNLRKESTHSPSLFLWILQTVWMSFPIEYPSGAWSSCGPGGVGAVGLPQCQGAAERGPAPSGFSLGFSLRPGWVGINPTGVICITTVPGSGTFCSGKWDFACEPIERNLSNQHSSAWTGVPRDGATQQKLLGTVTAPLTAVHTTQMTVTHQNTPVSITGTEEPCPSQEPPSTVEPCPC